MKITDISAWQATGSFVKQWDDVDRVCRPMDIPVQTGAKAP